MVLSALVITWGLYCVLDVENVLNRTGVSLWFLLLVCFMVVLGWVFLLFVVVTGCLWYLRGEPVKGEVMLTYGVKLLVAVVAVTLYTVCWLL